MESKNDTYKEMNQLVKEGKKYLFKSIWEKGEDDYYFEPYEGIPIGVGSEMFVKVTKGNDVLKEGTVVGIDPSEFCFLEMVEV